LGIKKRRELAMPQVDANANRPDVGKEIIVDMVKAMVNLTSKVDTLNQKVEDLVASLDDHRSISEELNENMGEISGLSSTFLQVMDDMSQIAADDDKELEWSDLNVIFKKMKDSAEEEEEDDDEGGEEVKAEK
jgi:methyl-accepting chemotaxis protein